MPSTLRKDCGHTDTFDTSDLPRTDPRWDDVLRAMLDPACGDCRDRINTCGAVVVEPLRPVVRLALLVAAYEDAVFWERLSARERRAVEFSRESLRPQRPTWPRVDDDGYYADLACLGC